MKKQISALLIFVGYGIKEFNHEPRYQPFGKEPNPELQAMVTLLVNLTSAKSKSDLELFKSINKVAASSLNNTLSVIPAVDFVRAIEKLVGAESEQVSKLTKQLGVITYRVYQVVAGALELIAGRFPRISVSTREASADHIVSIVEKAQDAIQRPNLAKPALVALNVIANTGMEAELPALTRTLSSVIEATAVHESTVEGLGVIQSLT